MANSSTGVWSLLSPRPPANRWRRVARLAMAGYFAAMASVNVVVTLPETAATYSGLAQLSWPGFGGIPEALVRVGVPFTVVLIGWEIGISVLLLSKGRLVRIGLVAALLQMLALAPFLSWYELANVVTAVLVVALLARDYDRSLLDILRRTPRTRSASRR